MRQLVVLAIIVSAASVGTYAGSLGELSSALGGSLTSNSPDRQQQQSASLSRHSLQNQARQMDASQASYWSSLRQLFTTGIDAHEKSKAYSNFMPHEDPEKDLMLRRLIGQATELVDNYRQRGLSAMPPVSGGVSMALIEAN
jgi:hypothetical protein